MVGRLVRAGGSLLAALSIVAGGAVTGLGSAGATATGSADSGSLAPRCTPEGYIPGCDNGKFLQSVNVGDINLEYTGPDEAEPGSRVRFSSMFTAGPGGYQDVVPDVAIASVTHHPPRGFEFAGAEVVAYKPGWTTGATNTTLDATVTTDPVTGDVTVTAPAGGWAVPKSEYSPGLFLSGHVSVFVSYKVTDANSGGTSGVNFTGTGVPASEGWMATGATRVTGLGGFGSSN